MEFEREQTMHTCECEILLKKLSQHAIECVTAKNISTHIQITKCFRQ